MKFINLFKSRTFWVVVLLFLINGIGGIREEIPGGWLTIIDAALAVLTIFYAKISPKIRI